MSEQELTTLWSGYVSNRMTAEERQRFSELAVAEAHHEQLEELVAAFLREHQPRIKPYTDKQQVFEAIMAEALRREEHAVAATVVPIRSFSRSWKWAAAILLMATSAAVYFILHEEKSPPVAYTYHYAQQTAHNNYIKIPIHGTIDLVVQSLKCVKTYFSARLIRSPENIFKGRMNDAIRANKKSPQI
jgi:hypothetical protein